MFLIFLAGPLQMKAGRRNDARDVRLMKKKISCSVNELAGYIADSMYYYNKKLNETTMFFIFLVGP